MGAVLRGLAGCGRLGSCAANQQSAKSIEDLQARTVKTSIPSLGLGWKREIAINSHHRVETKTGRSCLYGR